MFYDTLLCMILLNKYSVLLGAHFVGLSDVFQ